MEGEEESGLNVSFGGLAYPMVKLGAAAVAATCICCLVRVVVFTNMPVLVPL